MKIMKIGDIVTNKHRITVMNLEGNLFSIPVNTTGSVIEPGEKSTTIHWFCSSLEKEFPSLNSNLEILIEA